MLYKIIWTTFIVALLFYEEFLDTCYKYLYTSFSGRVYTD